MVKAPSSHGLDRKFKPWRKGKSAHAKKQGSLKHQLRGQQRLLARLQKQNQDTTAIEQSMDRLKQEIAQKEHQEHAKQHAKKSHGTRFLERQRLTRLERNARKHKQQDAQELLRIAMDQIYVAHYPLDNKSYRPLFKNGKRWLHHSVSRATLRNTILQGLANQTISRVKWIPQDQYNRVLTSTTTWTVEQEVQLYKYPTLANGAKQKKKAKVPNDSRFALAQSANREALLQAAQEEESKLDERESKEESDSDSSNSSEEEVAPVAATSKKSKADDSSESSSDSSSSDEEEDDPKPKASSMVAAKKRASKESCSSSDSSSSSSDSDSSDEEEPTTNKQSPAHHNKRTQEEPTPPPAKEEEDDDSEDEFLIAAKDDKDEDVNVFDKVQQQQELPAENLAKGDKSQGWATQQQRPGKYKKKRTRR